MPTTQDLHHAQLGVFVTQAFAADLACIGCAEAVERALRAHPHVTGVHVDYPNKTVHVTYHPAVVTTPETLARLLSESAHDCPCAPAGAESAGTAGTVQSLAHYADMAAVTMGTTADGMHYEFPSTAAGKRRAAGHDAHGTMAPTAPDHAGPHPAEPAGSHGDHAAVAGMDHGASGGHRGMGHDMSDPRMAKALEREMRDRFFGALLLTLPTILFSRLAKNTFGIALVRMSWANWLAGVPRARRDGTRRTCRHGDAGERSRPGYRSGPRRALCSDSSRRDQHVSRSDLLFLLRRRKAGVWPRRGSRCPRAGPAR